MVLRARNGLRSMLGPCQLAQAQSPGNLHLLALLATTPDTDVRLVTITSATTQFAATSFGTVQALT